ncbi:MAG: hypothetical protein K1X78_15035 [Verrucomicrobiaceae bacterium]|nr:hypothetical protein [Verrucomicrobiaceae bacterium]
MRFTISSIQFHVLPMQTRFPFKYGIASMTSLPHLFVTADLVVDGVAVSGLSSEGLPPKWFTKDPDTIFEADLAEMLAVIQNAARIAMNAAEKPVTFFELWRAVYVEQERWAGLKQLPPLLANLGVSLVEKSVLCALCRHTRLPLHRFLKTAAPAIDFGAIRPELRGITCADFLPDAPLDSVFARHTIGLGDPLRASELSAAERLDDGLPYALDDSIRAYGLRFFKIKVCGRPGIDAPRLREIAAVLTALCPEGFKATLDGNEQFHDLRAFREFYDDLAGRPELRPLFDNLVLIEQPMHRSKALDDSIAPVLQSWRDGPGMIIDESDGSLADLPRALSLGYRGTSHKNCKGIVKGLANAALLHVCQSQSPGAAFHLSGEDLAGVGPVAMLQDLAMTAMLGIGHVERNGHHYFRGLSMYPDAVQWSVLETHAGFYRRHEAGFPTLDIRDGRLALSTVNGAPFGFANEMPVSSFETLECWIKRGGMAAL